MNINDTYLTFEYGSLIFFRSTLNIPISIFVFRKSCLRGRSCLPPGFGHIQDVDWSAVASFALVHILTKIFRPHASNLICSCSRWGTIFNHMTHESIFKLLLSE